MERPMLLNGWYPQSFKQCKQDIESFRDDSLYIEGRQPVSAIVPHAGWIFCGRLAVNTLRILKEKNGEIDNVVIFGGHLSPNNIPMVETFSMAKTPFGMLKNDERILQFIQHDKNVQASDYRQDNTIEILLPIVHYFFGDIKITCVYLAPNNLGLALARKIHSLLPKNTVFIGSTDLTHYGPNYNFFHTDKSMDSVDWVKNVNDKGYIDLLLKMKVDDSIKYAINNQSACSSGAAAGAMLCAKESGVSSGIQLGYSTSYDIRKDKSFVSYTGILF